MKIWVLCHKIWVPPRKNHHVDNLWCPYRFDRVNFCLTIGKPLLPMVLETKNHCKTIDINGGFPTILLMAMVSMKTY